MFGCETRRELRRSITNTAFRFVPSRLIMVGMKYERTKLMVLIRLKPPHIMLKITLLLLACTMGINLSAQNDTIKETKRKFTTWTIKSDVGVTTEIIRLKDGKKEGAQEKFYRDGKILSRINYTNDYYDDEYLTYDNQGKVKEIRTYKYLKKKGHSILHGKYEAYSRGEPILKSTYKDSLLHGKYITYRTDGKKKLVASYRKGLMKGEKLSYNYLGGVAGKVKYKIITEDAEKKSVLHGPYKYYENDGALKEVGQYVEGKQHEVIKKYIGGEPYTIVTYKNGKQHGYYAKYQKGKLQSEGHSYEEIVHKGDTLKNVHDGELKAYFSDGNVEKREIYVLGVKTGTWEKYHVSGNLISKKTYEDGLQVGTYETWEYDGTKTFLATYKINRDGDEPVSEKSGIEKRWEKGILVFERTTIEGEELELMRTYYPYSGKLMSEQTLLRGSADGEKFEYHENGKLKAKTFYKRITQKDGKEKATRFGWLYQYDDAGLLKGKSYLDEQGNGIAGKAYIEGQLIKLTYKGLMEVNYFPTGEVLSYHLYDCDNRPAFSQYFYWSGAIRKLGFQNPENEIVNYINFSNAGEIQVAYSKVHNNPEDKRPSAAIVQRYIDKVGSKAIDNRFLTDSIRNGKYTLMYPGNQVMAELNFKDDLPHGPCVFYDALTQDTLSFKNFAEGRRVGKYLDKFGGIAVKNKGELPGTDGVVWKEAFYASGLRRLKESFDSKGERVEYHQYHPNGKIKSKQNYPKETDSSFDTTGLMMSETTMIDEKIKLKCYKSYYPSSKQVKKLNYTKNGLKDSTYEMYYESGQLHYKLPYLAGKRHGLYEMYNEDGSLKTKGNYVDDQQEGLFLIAKDGVTDSVYYANGKRQIKPPSFACECLDTTESSSRAGFAPMIRDLLEYPLLLKFLPGKVVPVDSLNYTSIFCTGLQTSSGNSGGFYYMNLMLFRELSFSVPADEQLKICLNPCRTKGYRSRMQFSVTTNYTDENETYANMYPERISIELPTSPLKSTDTKQGKFRGYFDTKSIDMVRGKKFDFKFINPQNDCFTPGVINNFLHIEVEQAVPLIFKNPSKVTGSNDMQNLNLSAQELSSFFGFALQKSSLTFMYEGDTVTATSDYILAGGNYVSGKIEVACEKNNAGDYKCESVILTEKSIRKEWGKKGFTRLSFEYDEEKKQLSISFFAEKL
jgi:antitoxin component YwqK of YwqJK toxin-antitoxin module